MKVTDYIVQFLISKSITCVFGYPGGVICHLIDSLSKYTEIENYITYHEQGAAFAACGYAQESGLPGIAYTTSGPGATNLITGIANAYYDSIPTIFLTGQVDTYGLKGNLNIRQRGFQETNIVGIVKPITKYAIRIDEPQNIRYELEKAYNIATSNNPGPVVLDLPADVQRADVDENSLVGYYSDEIGCRSDSCISTILNGLNMSKRPCLLIGCGVKQSGERETIKDIIETLNIPAVFSMPAIDVLPSAHKNNFGFIGANGHRYGNFVLGKSDLIISFGSRMDLKQVGGARNKFAEQANIIRVDIDEDNLNYKVHNNEQQCVADLKTFLPELLRKVKLDCFDFEEWRKTCETIKKKLVGFDDEDYTKLIKDFSMLFPENISITADVGQSEVWIAQQFQFKESQSFHLSGGHGAMGYSLPAAIGAYYAGKKPVISFNGDGGIQMNIQELQFLARERIPVTVVIINNHSLGMIRGFQEANFDKNYQKTTEMTGYSSPNFEKIANAYNLPYYCIKSEEDIKGFTMNMTEPNVVEIMMPHETVLKPNFGQTGIIQDQRPYISRSLYEELMNL